MNDNVVTFQGETFQRDDDFDDHKSGVYLLLYQRGRLLFREFATLEQAVAVDAEIERQIDYSPSGIAEFAPHVVIDRDGNELHRF